MKSIALFGGTFNPIHFGHLAIAEGIRAKYDLDKVIFVPTHTPPHKQSDELVSAFKRAIMVHLATVSNPCFDVSTVEVDRGGKSYSIDTVRYFSQLYEGKVGIYFIVGADMLAEIGKWKNIGELLKLCRFIAVSRPGYDAQRIFNQNFLSSENFEFATALVENVLIEEMPMLEISASDIRRKVREWKSIKYLVPEAVEQFIHNQKLYL
ncbi:MAG TPA: nicotinate-nucleotide adenylyltransferase [bacterium]|nr:nicotinate-nucleotide adenylyltransferase [bacterium]